jgi:hypothetical protein
VRCLNDGPNVGCFSPGYDVAFCCNNILLFATQICFDCQKFTLPDTDGPRHPLLMQKDRQVERC